jgi:poly(3-hydroxybutyrate) depolymerase
MLYQAYQLQDDLLAPVRAFVDTGLQAMRTLPGALLEHPLARGAVAGAELMPFTGLRHERPAFAIDAVTIDGAAVAVEERTVHRTPFATLLHFAKQTTQPQPKVLIVAPLSGHYATLLRATVRTMLPEHDVYLTDWHNARDVPAEHGVFGLDEYIEHLIDFLGLLGEDPHLMAVCQPCAPALAATALMTVAGEPSTPRSLTLIAGAIDVRLNPNSINEYANSHPIEWFERNLTCAVPERYAGAGRLVYPGFLQAPAFMSMNADRHFAAFQQLFLDFATGERERAQRTNRFYLEYLTVLDIAAEFYLDTVERIFQRNDLALGRFEWRGQRVELDAITELTLLTIEGAEDDISALGQTAAAHMLCSAIAPESRRSHVQAGAGHYGVFSGRHWETEVYPLIRETIRAAGRRGGRPCSHGTGSGQGRPPSRHGLE